MATLVDLKRRLSESTEASDAIKDLTEFTTILVLGTSVTGGALTIPLLLTTSAKAVSGLSKLLKVLLPSSPTGKQSQERIDPAERADEIFYVFAQRAFLRSLAKLKGRIPNTKRVIPEKHASLVKSIELAVAKPEFAQASFEFGWTKVTGPVPLFQTYSVWLSALLKSMGASPPAVEKWIVEIERAARSELHKELVARGSERQWMVNYQLLENTADILSSLQSFFPEARLDTAWQHYLDDLAAKPKLPIWGEEEHGLSIDRLFVEPGYTYSRQAIERLCKVGEPAEYVGLQAFLAGLLSHRRPSTELIFVMGGPGSGKTSLMEVFCAEIASSGIARIILIPAKRINPHRSLLSEIQRLITEMGFGSIADTLVTTEDCIIAIDGFDELAHATLSTLDTFFRSAQDLVKERAGTQLRIVLSGRPTLFTANDITIPVGSHVITLEPFDEPRVKLWSSNWRRERGGSFEGAVYLKSDSRDLRELAAQPMLLYLLATMYEEGEAIPENFIDTRGVRFQIYGKILDWICRRQEEKRVPPSMTAKLRRYLQIAGLATHQSGQRTLHWRRFSRALTTAGLADEPGELEAKLHATILAFAFTSVEERAWEFTHKSFGEALAAEAIGRVLEDLAEPGRDGETWRLPLPAASKIWIETFGPHFLTKDVLDFCRGWLQVKGSLFLTQLLPRLFDVLQSVLGTSSADVLAAVAVNSERPVHHVLGNSVRSWLALGNAALNTVVDENGRGAVDSWGTPIGAEQYRTAVYVSNLVAPFSSGEAEILLDKVSLLVEKRVAGSSRQYIAISRRLLEGFEPFIGGLPRDLRWRDHRDVRHLQLFFEAEHRRDRLRLEGPGIRWYLDPELVDSTPTDEAFNYVEDILRHTFEPNPVQAVATRGTFPPRNPEEFNRFASDLLDEVALSAGIPPEELRLFLERSARVVRSK